MSTTGLIKNDEPQAPLYLVDDDDDLRTELAELLELRGYQVTAFPHGAEFLEAAQSLEPGCVLLDYNMPKMNGLEVLGRFDELGLPHKVVILTGHGEVSIAVTAMQRGAVHFLEKPIGTSELLPAISSAREALQEEAGLRERRRSARERIGRLSPREIEVLREICAGKPNKIIAYDLDLSIRTVENHRANVMTKTEAKSLAELIRLALAAGTLTNNTPA